MDFQKEIPVFQVACAMIIADRKVLVVKRGPGMKLPGKWEFPGGKLEQGESASACIVREIKEELSMDITIIQEWDPVEHNYGEYAIRLIPFICSADKQEPELIEHESYLWVDSNSIMNLDWASADIVLVDRISPILT